MLRVPVGAICQAIEVGTATDYRWRKLDQAFTEAWDSAREFGFDNLEAAIVEAGKRDWRALARYLEVHHPAWRRPCRRCRHQDDQAAG